MKQELFEFLCLYFPRIFTQKQKKAFRRWLGNYLAKATNCQQSGDYFFRENATYTLIIDISTPEWFPWGKDHLTRESRLRYIKFLGMIKIALILAGALGIFAVTKMIGEQNWFWAIATALVVGGILLLGFGLPHRYNFSKLATLATVIDQFVQEKHANLFIVDSEIQLYASVPSQITTKAISSIDDLYIGEQCGYNQDHTGQKRYYSFTTKAGTAFIPNKQRQKSDLPPKTFYEDFAAFPERD
ncbi:hypothetical protein [Enterococcus gallinarum]|uniref:hypothetical protein n=1 Tax=Enterococcus gallinarum TaxID=1353 RepID=UPI00288FD2CD|nr:hypothetical protein [Enterococcus gallinarum]MDT2719678.1 hypothetical protein [Enterococcus gallinarum]